MEPRRVCSEQTRGLGVPGRASLDLCPRPGRIHDCLPGLIDDHERDDLRQVEHDAHERRRPIDHLQRVSEARPARQRRSKHLAARARDPDHAHRLFTDVGDEDARSAGELAVDARPRSPELPVDYRPDEHGGDRPRDNDRIHGGIPLNDLPRGNAKRSYLR